MPLPLPLHRSNVQASNASRTLRRNSCGGAFPVLFPKRILPFARIALIYALFGALWILFSNRTLLLMVQDSVTMARESTYKGWAIIALPA